MTEREQPPPKAEQESEQQFLERSKAALDEQLDQVDAATQTRLRAMRREAMELAQQSNGKHLPWAKPLAFACVVSLAVVLLIQQQNPSQNKEDLLLDIALDDMALLSDPQAMEFYQELEFYEWLEQQAQLPQGQV